MREVTAWISNDGKVFLNKAECIEHEALLNGRQFVCPKCKGKCEVRGEPIKERLFDRELTGAMGSMTSMTSLQIVGYEYHPCDICEGHGYTKEFVEPVTKEVITGYAIKK